STNSNTVNFSNLLAANNTITGNIINQGVLNSATSAVTKFAAGSTYQHDENGGTIPAAVWDPASGCSITSSSTGVAAGLNQTFGSLTVATGAGVISAMSGAVTVAGTLSLTSGNLNLNGQQLTLNGTTVSGGGTLYSNSTSSVLSIAGAGTVGTLGFASGA